MARMILGYLHKNPDASDTLEGILEWWLESERIEKSVNKVSGALEILLEKGLLKKVKSENGPLVYKIN